VDSAGAATCWGRILPEILEGSHQSKLLLVADGFAHEEIQELRTFIPPMAEELGVVGAQHHGRAPQDVGKLTDLLHPRAEEVRGVLVGGGTPILATIELLLTGTHRWRCDGI
jgi:hypothetical protein